MPNSKLKGFTLVELIVTITIIAILVSISSIMYSNIQKTSRDAKRQADIKNIQSALEQYHADQNFYPTDVTISAAGVIDSSTGNPSPPTPAKTYLSRTPTDPLSGNPQYTYIKTPSGCTNAVGDPYCTGYTICAKMENITGGSCPGDATRNYSITPQ